MSIVDSAIDRADIEAMSTQPGNTVNADWFKQQLEQRRLSQRKLARFLELDPSAITLTLNGKRRMQLDEASRIATFLGVPVEEVLKNAGLSLEQNQPRLVALYGAIDSGNQVEVFEDRTTVEAPPILPSNVVAVVVMNHDSLIHRALAYFLLEDTINPGAIGRLAIARLRDGRMFFSRIEPGSRPGLYNLKIRSSSVPHDASDPDRTRISDYMKHQFSVTELGVTPEGFLKDVALTAAMPILLIQP
jgi:transcriptional regulator with XRE-family HTH domain